MKRREGVDSRMYGALLWLYPRGFRRRHGFDMRADFATLRAEYVRSDGRVAGVVRAWRRALRDLARSLALAWGTTLRKPGGAPRGLGGGWAADARSGIRALAREPGYSALTAATLGLGLAAVTAFVALAQATLWSPLPGVGPIDDLVAVFSDRNGQLRNLSYPDFEDLRDHGTLEGASAATVAPVALGTGSAAERVVGALVTPGLFDLLAARAHRGRLLQAGDDGGVGASRVVVLSYAAWRQRFGADPEAIGSDIVLNGIPYRVVGVAEPAFSGPWLGRRPEVWVPVRQLGDFLGFLGEPVGVAGERILSYRGYMMFEVFARSRSIAAARAAVAGVATDIRAANAQYPLEMTALPLQHSVFDPAARQSVAARMWVLGALAFAILAIATANVIGVGAVRAARRRSEVWMRRALGASILRLVRQGAVHGVILAGVGALLGVSAVAVGLPLLGQVDLGVAIRPWVRIDGVALVVAAASALATGMSIGVAGALGGLVGADRGHAGASRTRTPRLAHAALFAQVALSFAVLAMGLALGRTLVRLQAVDLGFETGGVTAAWFDPSQAGHDSSSAERVIVELIDTLRAHGGFTTVAIGSEPPLAPAVGTLIPRVEGLETAVVLPFRHTLVSEGYFETLSVSARAGRLLDASDTRDAAPVVLVNETLAGMLWPQRSALGQRMAPGEEGNWHEVVGVVADYRHEDPRRDPEPRAFWPVRQVPHWAKGASARALLVRSAQPHAEVVVDMRALVAGVDPDMPLFDIDTLDGTTRSARLPERRAAVVANLAAAATLLLTAIGLFGLTSYVVSGRAYELGVRMALGADSRQVVRTVLAGSVATVALGMCAGAVIARTAGDVLQDGIYRAVGTDWGALGLAAVGLALIAILAAAVPAWRAVATDPVIALREG